MDPGWHKADVFYVFFPETSLDFMICYMKKIL
jgi:hypothetical protein